MKKVLNESVSMSDGASSSSNPKAAFLNEFLLNRLEGANQMLFYIFALFLPIWFIPINIGIEFSREISFSVIIIIAFVLWLLKLLQSGEIYYRSSLINLGTIAFLLVSFLSSLFSANPLYSIFFSDTISEKTITFFLGAVLMFLLGSIGRESSYGIKIFFILIFAGALSGIYSLLQFFNVLRLPFEFARASDFNVIGTVNGLAFFYCILFLMSLSVISAEKKGKGNLLPPRINLAFFLAALIFIFNLIVINYQFVWVTSLLGSVFLLGLRFTFNESGRFAFSKRSVLVILMVIFSILMILIRTPFFKSVAIPVEVAPSLSATINIAKSVLQEDTKSLLLGSGPATFGFDFDKYKDIAMNTTPFWALRFNQGFSYIFTALATEGILGFLAVISFLGLILFVFLKFILENRAENIFIVPIFIGILASVLSLVVYRANLSLVLFLFFLSGLFFVVSGIGMKKLEFRTSWLSFISSMAVLFLISLAVFFGYFLEENFRAAVHFQNGASFLSKGNISSAIAELDQASSIGGSNDRYFRALAQAHLVEIQGTINKASYSKDSNLQAEFQNQVSAAIRAAQSAVEINRSDSLNWRTLASVYTTVIPFIQGAERFAFDAYNKAAERDPKNPNIFIDLGRSELVFVDRIAFLISQSGQSKETTQALKQIEGAAFEQAISSFSKAIELKPDLADANFLLAQAFIRKGDMAEAIRRVEAARIQSPFDIGIAFQLGFLYYKSNQLDKAESEFLRAISLNSNYSNARYFLGLIYSYRGDKARAIEEFERVRELNPDNKEVVKIILNLRLGRPALEGVAMPAGLDPRDTAPIINKSDEGGKKNRHR